MAALNRYINKFYPLITLDDPSRWKHLPLFFFAVALGGSLLKEMDVVPETYFSDKSNLFNVYFVKFSWGWTLFLLLPFICLSNSSGKNLVFVLKRLSSLAVATAIWRLCTESFFYIEEITGACYNSNGTQILQELGTKEACRKAGFKWDGFDISGHCFILSYSTLLIVEEIAPMKHIKKLYHNRFLDLLYIALNAIILIWIWMFCCTSVYFHDTVHKLLGTSFGILGWSVTYKFWYRSPLSPGLPPCLIEHKQQRLD